MPRRRKNGLNQPKLVRERTVPYHLRASTNARTNANDPNMSVQMNRRRMQRQARITNTETTGTPVCRRYTRMAAAIARSGARRSVVVLHRNPGFKASGQRNSTMLTSGNRRGMAPPPSSSSVQSRATESIASVQTMSGPSDESVPKVRRSQRLRDSQGRQHSAAPTSSVSLNANGAAEDKVAGNLTTLQTSIRDLQREEANVADSGGPTTSNTPTAERQEGGQRIPTLSSILADLDHYLRQLCKRSPNVAKTGPQ